MNQPAPTSPITVDIVVYPGFKAMEAIGPMSVFEYANLHRQRRGQGPGYDVRVASFRTGPVQSDTLMSLDATKAVNTLALPHTAIVVGARHIQDALVESAAIIDWVAKAAPRIVRLASLCSGAFFLAAAGVLDGKRATTTGASPRACKPAFPPSPSMPTPSSSAPAMSGPRPASRPAWTWRSRWSSRITAVHWRWKWRPRWWCT